MITDIYLKVSQFTELRERSPLINFRTHLKLSPCCAVTKSTYLLRFPSQKLISKTGS